MEKVTQLINELHLSSSNTKDLIQQAIMIIRQQQAEIDALKEKLNG
jgi:FtsZ-binding cell division protein ZapB